MNKNYILVLALFFTLTNYGQFLVSIDRNNQVGPTTTGSATNISAVGLTRAPAPNGPTFNTGPDNFSSKKWTTNSSLDLEKYIEWSVSVDPGYSVILTTVDISLRRNNNGPSQLDLYFSYDGFATSTFADTITLIDDQRADLTIPLPVALASGQTVTFRLYGYNAATANGVLNVFKVPGGGLFGVSKPGVKIRGIITPVDLIYTANVWTPLAPNASTFTSNAYVLDGTYTLPAGVALNTLNVSSLGNVLIPSGILTIVNTSTFESTSINYPSLIMNGVLTGVVNYKRHANIANNNGAITGKNDLISAPLSGQTFGAFASANQNIVSDPNNSQRKLFGPFDKTTGTYTTYNSSTNASVPLLAGLGYRAASKDNGNFIFTGVVNKATITRTILNTGPQFQEWNLVGNPYPSYIKLADFLAANNSQFSPSASGVYGYDGEASDGYTIWNQAFSDANPGKVITPGQGFLVTSKVGGGTITFTPAMRTIGNTDDFIAGRSSNDNTISFLKLNVTNDVLSANTDFYFTENATLGLDPGYDSSIFGTSAPSFSLYSRLAQDNLGVNMGVQSIGVSNLKSDVIIPIGINASQGQQLTLSISETTLPSDVTVYLEDKVTGTFTLLNASDYVFTSNTNLNGTGRFFLRFSEQTLSNPDITSKELQIFTSASPRALFIKGQLTSTTNIAVYDVQGRVVLSKQLEASSNSNQVDVSNLSSGIYVVKLNNTTQQKTQKVILK